MSEIGDLCMEKKAPYPPFVLYFFDWVLGNRQAIYGKALILMLQLPK